MRRLIGAGLLIAVVAGCAPQAQRTPPRTGQPAAVVPPPSRYATPVPYVTQKPSTQPKPPETAADACGAAAHAYLVGKNRSEIPIPVDPSKRRVACSTCPVTEEHQPTRLNIFYDADSGKVTEVRCG
jgi:hypothetical protein